MDALPDGEIGSTIIWCGCTAALESTTCLIWEGWKRQSRKRELGLPSRHFCPMLAPLRLSTRLVHTGRMCRPRFAPPTPWLVRPVRHEMEGWDLVSNSPCDVGWCRRGVDGGSCRCASIPSPQLNLPGTNTRPQEWNVTTLPQISIVYARKDRRRYEEAAPGIGSRHAGRAEKGRSSSRLPS